MNKPVALRVPGKRSATKATRMDAASPKAAAPGVPTIGVVGLGYVGLPLAVMLSRHFPTFGYDISRQRIAQIAAGHDSTGEISRARLSGSAIQCTANADDVRGLDIYVVTAPTPVDDANRPNLQPLLDATRAVARVLDPARKPIIVFESTVWPGVTEDICGPAIEQASGLTRGVDFFLAYSPERINPGDREHTVDRIVKVVAGENDAVTDRISDIYSKVTSAGVFRAASIKAAEAAKVIENAQRDINIAFMNEITQVFAKLDISIFDVLDAAGTKWNFLPFRPGLVGGHCIGVDPYYLSHCAQSVGHLPRVILAGRSINDGMGTWIADSIHSRRRSRAGTVLVLGLTFKPDVPDMRNSKVVDVIRRLQWLGHDVTVHDPLADAGEAQREFGIALAPDALDRRHDIVLAAVPHAAYRNLDFGLLTRAIADGGLLADLHGLWRHAVLPREISLWTP